MSEAKNGTTPAQFLKRFIAAHKMTQAEVGKLVGVSQGTISSWAAGKTDPGFNQWQQIKATLRASKAAKCSPR